MPFLDAHALKSDPEGMTFLQAVIGKRRLDKPGLGAEIRCRYSRQPSRCLNLSKTPDRVIARDNCFVMRSPIRFSQSLGSGSRSKAS